MDVDAVLLLGAAGAATTVPELCRRIWLQLNGGYLVRSNVMDSRLLLLLAKLEVTGLKTIWTQSIVR
jgi:hypothetical protein